MLEPRQEVGVAVVAGKIYVAGGFRAGGATVATVEVYDPATNSWTFAAPMPVGVNHPAAAAVGGKLYIIGGTSSSGVTSANQEYDPTRNEWRLRPPMPTARSAAAAALIGERVYVAGGSAAGRAFEAYDPRTEQWSVLPQMPTPRNHIAAGAVGTRFYAVGGRPPNTLPTLEAYDTEINTWMPLPPMPTGRSGIAGAVVRGCLYVFGGEGNASRPDGVFPQNEAYDPRRQSWESLAPMPTPRHGIGGAVIGDRIYIAGGATVQGFGVTGAHEVFTVPREKTCE